MSSGGLADVSAAMRKNWARVLQEIIEDAAAPPAEHGDSELYDDDAESGAGPSEHSCNEARVRQKLVRSGELGALPPHRRLVRGSYASPLAALLLGQCDCVAWLLVSWRRVVGEWIRAVSAAQPSLEILGFNSSLPAEAELLAQREQALEQLAGTNVFTFPFDPRPRSAGECPERHFDDVLVLNASALYTHFINILQARRDEGSAEALLRVHIGPVDSELRAAVMRDAGSLREDLINGAATLHSCFRLARRIRQQLVIAVERGGGLASHVVSGGGIGDAAEDHSEQADVASLRRVATPHTQLSAVAQLVGMAHALNPRHADLFLKRLQQQQEQEVARQLYSCRPSSVAMRAGGGGSAGSPRRESLSIANDSFQAISVSHLNASMGPPAELISQHMTSPLTDRLQGHSPLADGRGHSSVLQRPLRAGGGGGSGGGGGGSNAPLLSALSTAMVDVRDSIIPSTVLRDLEMICRTYGMEIPMYTVLPPGAATSLDPKSPPMAAGASRVARGGANCLDTENFGPHRLSVDLRSPLIPDLGQHTQQPGSPEAQTESSGLLKKESLARQLCSVPRSDVDGVWKKNFANKRRDVSVSTTECKAVFRDSGCNTSLTGPVGAQHIIESLSSELECERGQILALQQQLLATQHELVCANNKFEHFSRFHHIEMVQKAIAEMSMRPPQAYAARLGTGGVGAEEEQQQKKQLRPQCDPEMEGGGIGRCGGWSSASPPRSPESRSAREHRARKLASFLSDDEMLILEGRVTGELRRRESPAGASARARARMTPPPLHGFQVRSPPVDLEAIERANPQFDALPRASDAPLNLDDPGVRVLAAATTATSTSREQVMVKRGEDRRKAPRRLPPKKAPPPSPDRASPPLAAAETAKESPPTMAHVFHRSLGPFAMPHHFGPRGVVSHCGSAGPAASSVARTPATDAAIARFGVYSGGCNGAHSGAPNKRLVLL